MQHLSSIHDWLNSKLTEISTRLPTMVHENPASFACGYNTGYKRALLDLEHTLQDLVGPSDIIQ